LAPSPSLGLRSFILESQFGISDASLVRLLPHFACLDEFRLIESGDGVTSEALLPALSRLPALRVLQLQPPGFDRGMRVTGAALRSLGLGCPRLEELRLLLAPVSGLENLNSLQSLHQSLHSLSVTLSPPSSSVSSSSSFASLSEPSPDLFPFACVQLPSLLHLEWYCFQWDAVSDPSLRALRQIPVACPSLRSLSLDRGPLFPGWEENEGADEEVASLVRCLCDDVLPRLAFLRSFTYSRTLPSHLVSQLRHAFPRLAILARYEQED
jgi:hypothetical protein